MHGCVRMNLKSLLHFPSVFFSFQQNNDYIELHQLHKQLSFDFAEIYAKEKDDSIISFSFAKKRKWSRENLILAIALLRKNVVIEIYASKNRNEKKRRGKWIAKMKNDFLLLFVSATVQDQCSRWHFVVIEQWLSSSNIMMMSYTLLFSTFFLCPLMIYSALFIAINIKINYRSAALWCSLIITCAW